MESCTPVQGFSRAIKPARSSPGQLVTSTRATPASRVIVMSYLLYHTSPPAQLTKVCGNQIVKLRCVRQYRAGIPTARKQRCCNCLCYEERVFIIRGANSMNFSGHQGYRNSMLMIGLALFLATARVPVLAAPATVQLAA